MKIAPIILVSACFALSLVSCTSDQALEPIIVNTDTCIAAGHIVTYTADIKTILETHCTDPIFGDCHQPGSSTFDYTNYTNIAAEAANGNLWDRVLNPNTILTPMPSPASAEVNVLTPCDTAEIGAWIRGGWPEN
jgi:hypothetical protein